MLEIEINLPSLLQENKLYKCPYCSNDYTKKGIKSHIWSKHTEEGRQFRANQKSALGKTPWNKGQTKETNEKVKQCSETLKTNIKNGKVDRDVFSHPHSEETKQHLSEIRKQWLNDNKDKHNWSLYHNQESDPEKKFRTILNQLNIDYLSYYIPPESNRFFEIDFALPNRKIGFEVNGNQHYNKNKTLTSYYQNRHDYLENLGWTIIEIPYYECYKEDIIKNIITNVIK